MVVSGALSQSVSVTQSEVIGGVTYSGTVGISLDEQVRSPGYTKAWSLFETIAAPKTLTVWLGAVAVASGTITYGTPADGSTVIVTGPTGGPFTFTKVAATPGANQFTTIAELTALIEAIDGLGATNDGLAITVTVTVPGTGPNAWTITGTSAYSTLSVTFSGGTDPELVGPFGNAIGFGTVGALVLKNTSTTASLTIGGGANPLLAALPPITPGGAVTLVLDIATSPTVKNLLLTPSASLSYELLILGT